MTGPVRSEEVDWGPGGRPTERFTGRARDYAAHRPGYPSAAIDAVLDGLPGAERGGDGRVVWGGRCVDVGAGTGISARLLAARGVEVVAAEPNAAMREAAAPYVGEVGSVSYVSGRAEATGVDDGSVGLVVAFQAFHWFERGPFYEECRRVLGPGGRVALVWNRRDPGDAFMRAYDELVTRHAPGRISSAWADDTDVLGLLEDEFGGARSGLYLHEDRLDAAGTIGRAMSASYVPNEGWARERFEGELMALFQRHAARGEDGVERVTWGYEAGVYVVGVGG